MRVAGDGVTCNRNFVAAYGGYRFGQTDLHGDRGSGDSRHRPKLCLCSGKKERLPNHQNWWANTDTESPVSSVARRRNGSLEMQNPTRGGVLDKGLSKKAGAEIIHLPLQTPKQVDRQALLKCRRAWIKPDDYLLLCIHRARMAAYKRRTS